LKRLYNTGEINIIYLYNESRLAEQFIRFSLGFQTSDILLFCMNIYKFSLPENEKISPLDQFGHKIQEIVMPIVAREGDVFRVLGTGFTINSDGIMITATHVISDFIPPNSERKDEFEIYSLYISGEKDPKTGNNIGGFMPIKIAWYSEELDIAYCWIQRPIREGKAIELPRLSLSPGIPKVGEKLLCFGYYKSEAIMDKENFIMNYSQNTGLTHGKVLEVLSEGRDKVLIPFPCFRTDCQFNSQMSGSPVFNSKGHVCGVVCRSFDLTEGEDPLAYASLIWPSIITPINVNFKKGDPLKKVRIYELIEKGLIHADETFSKIFIDRTDDNITKIGYRY
jgi:hypothetical protein